MEMWVAAASGAAALAVIFGVRHLPAAVLIFVSAAAGVVLRRSLTRYSDNAFLQPWKSLPSTYKPPQQFTHPLVSALAQQEG